MAIYWASVIEGGGTREFFQGIRRKPKAVAASSRVDAYLQLYRELAADGAEVTAMARPNDLPLNFTPEELERIRSAGGAIVAGTPRAGFQIEQIVRAHDSPDCARAEVCLPEIPGIVLSSNEDEAEGRWIIFYTWDRAPATKVVFPVSEGEIIGLVSQAEQAALLEGRPFDIEAERRRAADTVVVRQIRDLIPADELSALAVSPRPPSIA